MFRMLVLYERPLDVEAFERHYWDVHIPLAKKLPGLRGYTVSRDMTPLRGGEPYYLVGQLEWDDAAALRQAFQSLEGQACGQDMAILTALCPGVRSMTYGVDDVLA